MAVIEDGVGFSRKIGGVVGRANEFLANKNEVFLRVTREFNEVVGLLNTIPTGEIDKTLAPHLLSLREALTTRNLNLPNLDTFRESKDPKVRTAVETVMDGITDTVDHGDWDWLGEINKPGKVAGALYIEGYERMVRNIPEYEELMKELRKGNLVLAFEEASFLYRPEFILNRYVYEWYNPSEGFSKDFIQYAQSMRLIQICLSLDKGVILEREKIGEVFQMIRKDPHILIDQMRVLDDAIDILNGISVGKVDHKLINTIKVKKALFQRRLPRPLEGYHFNLGDALALRQMMRKTNRDLAKGEESEEETIPGQVYEGTPLTLHVDAKGEEANEVILAGLLVHAVELYSHSFGEYKGLGHDTLLNAICEMIGRYFSDSKMFEYLYYKRYGANWYDQAWGFSQEFMDYLRKRKGEA